MRNVLIATPSYDGRLDAWYVNSLLGASRLCASEGINLHPVFMSYDALIQRSRNDLIQIAVAGEYESMIFIDSDMVFDPLWALELILSDKDVIGGTTRKKTDDHELYSVKTRNLKKEKGLIKVDCLGTGFVKISRNALLKIWEASEEYSENGESKNRMVCDVKIIDGELWSEDRVMSKKLTDAGFDIWLNPNMTCGHVGTKVFQGDFNKFVDKILAGNE